MRILKTRAALAVATTAALALALGACAKSPEVKEAELPLAPQSEVAQSSPSLPQSGEEVPEAELPLPVEEEYWTLSSSADPGMRAEQPAIVTGFEHTSDAEYDRFTITLTGEGPVGWNARYVEEAVEAGRGEVIALAGNAFLDIGITGVSIPETDEDYAVYYEGGPLSAPGLNATYDGTFEGVAHFVIGMESPRQFDMFMLANPLRVVVDLRK